MDHPARIIGALFWELTRRVAQSTRVQHCAWVVYGNISCHFPIQQFFSIFNLSTILFFFHVSNIQFEFEHNFSLPLFFRV
jgi:hypothetical protein